MVRHAVIQPQVAFTVAQWHTAREAVLQQVRHSFAGLSLVVRSSTHNGFILCLKCRWLRQCTRG